MHLAHAALIAGTAFSCQTGEFVSPHNAPASGDWTAGTILVATGDRMVSCMASDVTFQLQQNDATVSGSYAWAAMTCTGPGAPPSLGVTSGLITNGAIVGDQVAFRFSGVDMEFDGTLAGGKMSGSCSLHAPSAPPAGDSVLTGDWTAVRD
jgi:hypothetical protein